MSSIFDRDRKQWTSRKRRVSIYADTSAKKQFPYLQKFELAEIALVPISDVIGIRCGCKIGHTCMIYIHRHAATDTNIHTHTHKTQAGFLRYIPPVVISI